MSERKVAGSLLLQLPFQMKGIGKGAAAAAAEAVSVSLMGCAVQAPLGVFNSSHRDPSVSFTFAIQLLNWVKKPFLNFVSCSSYPLAYLRAGEEPPWKQDIDFSNSEDKGNSLLSQTPEHLTVDLC